MFAKFAIAPWEYFLEESFTQSSPAHYLIYILERIVKHSDLEMFSFDFDYICKIRGVKNSKQILMSFKVGNLN